MEKQASIQSPLHILVFANSRLNLRKSRYQSFLVLLNFASFSNFWQSFLSLIVNEVDIEKVLVSGEFAYGKNKETVAKYFIEYNTSKKQTTTNQASANDRIYQ